MENLKLNGIQAKSKEMPGTVKIKAFIDIGKSLPSYPYDISDDEDYKEEDGIISVKLVAPGLTAEQVRNVVAEGDDYTIKGTATGVDYVDYVLIGPKGSRTGDIDDVTKGLLIDAASVSENEFEEDITMEEGLDTGTWKILILHPGRDGYYGDGTANVLAGELKDKYDDLIVGSFEGKEQSQIEALILDRTVNVAGSDDIVKAFTFKVESPYVKLNPVESW